jgi:MoxR-like ATPase
VTATHRPHVVLTSNRSRDLSDALRRRCLYHWIDYPSLEKELAIVRARVPAISAALSQQVTKIMQTTRTMNLSKVPGVAETLDWANALVALNTSEVDREILDETVGCFLKDEADIAAFKAQFDLEHG